MDSLSSISCKKKDSQSIQEEGRNQYSELSVQKPISSNIFPLVSSTLTLSTSTSATTNEINKITLKKNAAKVYSIAMGLKNARSYNVKQNDFLTFINQINKNTILKKDEAFAECGPITRFIVPNNFI